MRTEKYVHGTPPNAARVSFEDAESILIGVVINAISKSDLLQRYLCHGGRHKSGAIIKLHKYLNDPVKLTELLNEIKYTNHATKSAAKEFSFESLHGLENYLNQFVENSESHEQFNARIEANKKITDNIKL